MTNNNSSHPGLYIHVPFCRTKCLYCDFFSSTDLALMPDFLAALEQEARLYAGDFAVFDTLYLGGGTPTLLTPEQLDGLFKNLRRTFTFAPDTEITLEANPDDLTREKLDFFRELGINRLSLGVQSFDEAELAFLGRRHTARQTRQALHWIRAAGFANLSLDLIYGLPGQTATAWTRSLEKALKFHPEHLSCYQLTWAPGTVLGKKQARGEIEPLGEEAEAELFLLTSRFLQERGYLHYEISNFARGDDNCSRHNLKYWNHTPYLGLGPGAHSFQGTRRGWNHRSVDRYCLALQAGAAPVAGAEELSPEQLRLEALCLGFRTREGVSPDLLSPSVRQGILADLAKGELVRVLPGKIVPTLKGFLVADRLPLWLGD